MTEPRKVTVAIVGDLGSPAPGHVPPETPGTPWDDRPHASVDAEGHVSLGEVVDEAAEQLGVTAFSPGRTPSETFPWIAFHDGTDTVPRPYVSHVHVLDDLGRLVFDVRWSEATIDQVVGAASIGLLRGDPERIYLIRQAPAGGGPEFELGWRLFMHAIDVSRDAADLLVVAEAIRRGLDVIRRRWPGWTQRRATPANLSEFLSVRVWTSTEVAALLGCTTTEASELLTLFGYVDTGSGSFERGATAGARLLAALVDDIVARRYPGLRSVYDVDRLMADAAREIVKDPSSTPYLPLQDYTIARDSGEADPPRRSSRLPWRR